MRQSDDASPDRLVRRQPWRAATAVRAFTLALATGLTLSQDAVGQSLPVLVGLVLVAGTCSTAEWGAWGRQQLAIPLSEALGAAVLLSLTTASPGLLVYLMVPAVVAGVRHGWVSTINSTIVAGVALLAAVQLAPWPTSPSRIAEALPWLLMGLGAGLLAAWQSRSVRTLEARQAPYVAARQLMAQLRDLTRSGAVGLDSTSLACTLLSDVVSTTQARQATLFTMGPQGDYEQLGTTGNEDFEPVLRTYLASRPLPSDSLVVPLRSAQELVGLVIVARSIPWSRGARNRAQAIADTFALQLDTAMLFDEVRVHAIAEERNRIAREMHDGVAQEIVALGYVVDEIESVSHQQETRQLAAELRHEISRIVSEIRLSIFDLRQHVGSGSLAAALSDYLQTMASTTDLRVHLIVDESGPPLSARTQTEVLRVAQEAITNVRKHADAGNLWVTWVTDGRHHLLQVEDDGSGNAEPRAQHWGLRTMQERAHAISAELSITERDGGGTVVRLMGRTTTPTEGGPLHEHHRAAG